MNRRLLMLAVLAGFLSTGCGTIIDAGHRGVKKVWGEVQDQALLEGFYFYNPISTDIEEITVRERKWTSQTEAYTNDVQNVQIGFAVNWRPEAPAITKLYKELGDDYGNVLIPQVVEEEIKEVVGKFKAVDIIDKRGEASSKMRSQITENLSAKSIMVVDFAITNLQFNKEFDAAVEAKVVAQERAKEEQNRTVQIEEQAKQKLIGAKAEAESIRIRAAALAQNARLVEFEAVQKWDGKMPTVMLGRGSTPFVDISSVMSGKK